MDLQDHYGYPEQPDFFKSARHITGIVLIIIGCAMALYIFVHIYQLIKKPEQIELFTRILPDDPNIREFSIDDQQIRIPMGVFYVLAYLVMAMLLSIASGIGIGFIKAGAGLIYPRVDRLEAKLTRESMKLKNVISKLKYRSPSIPEPQRKQKTPPEDEFIFGIKRDKENE